MYEGIKQATGKPAKKSTPLKSKTGETITDQDNKLARWVEHYLDLYSKENSVSQEALDAIKDLPVLKELDAEPTLEELNKAINALSCGKASGEDGIPPEIIKSGKPVLLEPLHKLLCQCWREAAEEDWLPPTFVCCVLVPTLFGIFFSLLLNFAFKDSEESVHLHTRSDGKLFNLSRLKAKKKVCTVHIREMLFADDTALTSHTEEDLQSLMDRFAHACKEFGLTISIKKTHVKGQGVLATPSNCIDNEKLEITHQFIYPGSTVTSKLSLEVKISKRIAKAAAIMAKCSFLPKFSIHVETKYEDNKGINDNIFDTELRDEETEVCFIDIAYDEIPERYYKESEDPRCFKSEKTARGLLQEGWRDTQDPIMCSYKLVTVKFEVWGLQTRVEQFVHKVVRDVLLLGHRQAFAWVDEWIDMTMEEVREYERATQEATNKKLGTFPPAIAISETPLPACARSGPSSAPSTPLSTEAPDFLSVPKDRPRKKSAPETLTLPDPARRDSAFRLPSLFSWGPSTPQPE
ncbi:cytoplasmic phosphatidylinositol transfer 1-like protein [Labeo rohita]|nr:cytoplasmic phosphatidylinositol transfer 1-like protein [Labeo rohita]